jgi:membrane protein DedA with SNARE-associated domain
MLSAPVLAQYAVVILPALVVAEQLGVPLPAVPALVAIGALAAGGEVSIPPVLGAIAVAALAVDLSWYELGRRRGTRALALVGRLSAEPEVYVRRARELFQRYGLVAVLVAKFVPGVTALMPPLAGALGMRRARFVVAEVVGVVMWAAGWLALGWSGYRVWS